jgi:hypothetical protein
MRFAALVATSSVLFLVGCSQPSTTNSGDFEGAEGAVAQTIADLAEAGRNREAVDICGGIISEDLREQLAAGESTCNDEVQKAIEDVDDFELDIKDISITGETATAQVDNGDAERTFELVRDGSDWRISSFG